MSWLWLLGAEWQRPKWTEYPTGNRAMSQVIPATVIEERWPVLTQCQDTLENASLTCSEEFPWTFWYSNFKKRLYFQTAHFHGYTEKLHILEKVSQKNNFNLKKMKINNIQWQSNMREATFSHPDYRHKIFLSANAENLWKSPCTTSTI